MIIEIHNKADAVEYGHKAGWCTAGKSVHYDKHYSPDKGRLFVIFKPNRKYPSFQLFLPKSGTPELRAKQNQPVAWSVVLKSNPDIKDQDLFDPSLLKGVNERMTSFGHDSVIRSELDLSMFSYNPYNARPRRHTQFQPIHGKFFMLDEYTLGDVEFVIEFSSEQEGPNTRIIARADCDSTSGGEFRVSDYRLLHENDILSPYCSEMIQDILKYLTHSITRQILHQIPLTSIHRELSIVQLLNRITHLAGTSKIDKDKFRIVMNGIHINQLYKEYYERMTDLGSFKNYGIVFRPEVQTSVLVPSNFL